MTPDKEKFKQACEKIIGRERDRGPIGTLSEKTLHAVLKNYFEPYTENHEIKLGSFYADVVGENGIIEVQTRNLYKLKEKLMYFLAVARVTLVFPLPRVKYVSWVNQETGEVSSKHKSPKKGKPADCFYELYGLKSLLKHPNLTVCVVMLDVCDYRNLDGWGTGNKRGSTRNDRIPLDICEEIYLRTPEDYLNLISFPLPAEFTTADFKEASGTPLPYASRAVNILYHMGLCEKIGKRGRSNLYKFVNNNHDGGH